MPIAPAAEPTPTGPPILIDSIRGTNLVAWREFIYAVPQALGAVHIDRVNFSRYPSIKIYQDRAAALRGIR